MKKIYHFLVSVLKQILVWFPMRKNTIVFESSSDFCDSSKALFDYMVSLNLDKKYNLCWLVDNPKKFINIESAKFYSKKPKPGYILSFLKGLYISVNAKYCFYTHCFIGSKLKKNQIRCFLTHASPPVKDSSGNFWNPYDNSIIVSTSEFASNFRCKSFGGGKDLIRYFGLPRNDKLFVDDKLKIQILDKIGCSSFNKIILWMPTFKHHKNNNRNDFNDSNVSKDISLLDSEHLDAINDELVKNNIVLLIKLHPGQNMNFIDITSRSNIRFLLNSELLDLQIELYNLMGVSDALITDFSSVYFDYLLVDKPIAFELGDFEKYNQGVGFIMDNPLEYMPGNKVLNIADFIDFIKDVSNNNDKFKNERNKLKLLNHDHIDACSSKRIVDYFDL